MNNKIYIVRRESRSENKRDEYKNETVFSKKEYVYKFFEKCRIPKEEYIENWDNYVEEFIIDKLISIKGYWKIIFNGCQACGKNCRKCWKQSRETDKDIKIKDFNVNIPNLENNIFAIITKNFYNVEKDVLMYDYPLTLEVTSFEKNKNAALKDAIKKAKKWIKNNNKFIDDKTKWLNEEYRWKRFCF